MIHGRTEEVRIASIGCDANARKTSVSRKKCPSGAFRGGASGGGLPMSRKIQKNEQIRTERKPRTVPIGQSIGLGFDLRELGGHE